MRTAPTVVLVHGAFADASGFAEMIRQLEAQNIEVRAPMNPLRGLASDADAITKYVSMIEAPVILVGHSYGGAVISQAARTANAIALVYLAAFALDVDESCASIQQPFPATLASTNIVPTSYDAPGAAGGPDLYLKMSEFHNAFCADLSTETAVPMAVSQRPLSAAAINEPATEAGWKDLPTWYMISEDDKVISPDCERFMAKRMNANVESVKGASHCAFISNADLAVSLIVQALGVVSGPS